MAGKAPKRPGFYSCLNPVIWAKNFFSMSFTPEQIISLGSTQVARLHYQWRLQDGTSESTLLRGAKQQKPGHKRTGSLNSCPIPRSPKASERASPLRTGLCSTATPGQRHLKKDSPTCRQRIRATPAPLWRVGTQS